MDEASSKPEKANLFTLPRELRDMIYEYACEGASADIKATATKPIDSENISLYFNPNVTSPRPNQTLASSKSADKSGPKSIPSTTATRSSPSQTRTPKSALRYLRHLRLDVAKNHETHEALKKLISEEGEGERAARYASVIQGYAMCALKLASTELTHAGVMLQPGALQVAVPGKDNEMVWTAAPGEVEIPFQRYLPGKNVRLLKKLRNRLEFELTAKMLKGRTLR
ncbi:hypothetical protein PRZ48_014727 [Zasmidium cellare]|uniref:Uncharacterized protein n=1 Tax=Zasmidium cellare TaxID=395010 RepID=A0ABR0DZA3_ZASCE|nr:hypothetical protein PRZ48_014727 [Zasmidium cellare]